MCRVLLLMMLAGPALPQLAIPAARDAGGHGGGGYGGGYSGGHGGGQGVGYGREHGGGYGHGGGHGGGYGHGGGHGGGYGHGGGHGGGYGHGDGGYKPSKCHPQTITKYRTVYKDKKADVVNNVEVRKPKPHVKKIVETRYTTIRYPVFITQVIKPLLTQVETKVRPLFFTKTINRYTTVKFTVTGIGQVTHTTVKFEKEYVTRCMKKGYGHGHRRDATDGAEVDVESDKTSVPTYRTQEVQPPTGIPYDKVDLEPSEGSSVSEEVQPTTVQPSQDTPAPYVGLRRPGPFRPGPPRPVGPPRSVGLFGALSQFGGLSGSQRNIRPEPYVPHPPLPRAPPVVIG